MRECILLCHTPNLTDKPANTLDRPGADLPGWFHKERLRNEVLPPGSYSIIDI